MAERPAGSDLAVRSPVQASRVPASSRGSSRHRCATAGRTAAGLGKARIDDAKRARLVRTALCAGSRGRPPSSSGNPPPWSTACSAPGLYAAVAIPMALVLGIVHIVNLAHGEFMMVAAYLAYFAARILGLDPFVSLVPVAVVMALLGLAVLQAHHKPRAESARAEPAHPHLRPGHRPQPDGEPRLHLPVLEALPRLRVGLGDRG